MNDIERDKIENPKPLTLEKLRSRIGCTIWIDTGEIIFQEQMIGKWAILTDITNIPTEAFWFTGSVRGFSDINYGVTWLAYDHKPKD